MDLDESVRKLFDGTWINLHEDGALDSFGSPGVYLLACPEESTADLNGKRVDASKVMYVGESTDVGGRLKKFKMSIIDGKRGHSAGRGFYNSRFRSKRPIYFSALLLPGYAAATANGLRKKGQIVCLEHFAIAHVLEETESAPWLNASAGGSLATDENEAD